MNGSSLQALGAKLSAKDAQGTLRSMRHLALFVCLVACGAPREPAAPVVRAEVPRAPPPPSQEPVVAQTPAPGRQETVAERARARLLDAPRLIARLQRQGASPRLVRLRESLARCPDADAEGCIVLRAAGYDAATREWVVLDLDASEGGVESFRLVGASHTAERVVLEGALDRPQAAALRRALRRYGALALPRTLVRAVAETEHSLNTYAPLVALEGGAVLWIETRYEPPEHVLHLMRRDGAGDRVLDRRSASRVPCHPELGHPELGQCAGDDGAQDEERCTDEALASRGELCVEPLSIEHVLRSPDGSSLLVLGTRQVAGHGGYPQYHWIVPAARE